MATLAELRTKVRQKADIEGATDRYPDSELTAYINDAIRRFRRLVSDGGSWDYLLTSDVLTTTAAQDYIALSALSEPFEQLLAVAIKDGNDWRALTPFEQQQTWDYGGRTESAGTPEFFRLSIGADSSVALRLTPTPDAVYDVEVIYLAQFEELSLDTDTYQFLGHEAWVVYTAAIDVAIKEDVAGGALEALYREREKIEAEIARYGRRVQAQPMRRVDMRGRRAESRLWRRREY